MFAVEGTSVAYVWGGLNLCAGTAVNGA